MVPKISLQPLPKSSGIRRFMKMACGITSWACSATAIALRSWRSISGKMRVRWSDLRKKSMRMGAFVQNFSELCSE